MAAVAIINPSFESGNVEWTASVVGAWSIQNVGAFAFDGSWAATFLGSYSGQAEIINNTYYPCSPGVSITASCMVAQGSSPSGACGAAVQLFFYDSSQVQIGPPAEGNYVTSSSGGTWKNSTVTATAPAGTAYVRIAAGAFRNSDNDDLNVDMFTWNLQTNRTITITSPLDDATYQEGQVVPFKVSLGGSNPPIVSVEYFRGATSIGTSTTGPEYVLNKSDIPVGTYVITAVGEDSSGTTYTSPAVDLIISAIPPITREFKASNSYTYLVAENFSGLSANMPSTALVTGVEVLCDYNLQALIRAKDLNVSDPTLANENVLFDIVDTGVIEIALFDKDETEYTAIGAPITATIDVTRSDFTIAETGTSDSKKWVTMSGAADSKTLGDDTALFGLSPIAASDFVEKALGLRFYPNLGTKPAYADSGDACLRFLLNTLRLRVYFDAGSAEYYFASPDKTQVIKGELVHSYVESGNFTSGDATGVLQLRPTLDIMDGTQTYIGGDWTIHAAYPPTDDNQIAEVAAVGGDSSLGMEYNGLPSYTATTDNRSRYLFITTNFYGDLDLNSIYGVNGVSRAFAFNGEDFYKIATNPDETKDQPRHVANHQGHLAIGFGEGRVDISVVGQPYNFDGKLGASSWAIGDKVTGLLPLTGTILGVFGSKSVWGISGTTVDNFSTQTVSPNIGAVEYTVADMGNPVYANAYGIYTLSQTQQYGDYLGTPMSQDISPWLRPRLVRKISSNKEVVVAWPVRSKNQYRLAFSDGYILSMTLNGQTVPTFSFQKYFLDGALE
jgi:hypothetical protein